MKYTEVYETKPSVYFDGAREDFVGQLPDNPAARILEVGCGYGGTGASALSQGKCREYVGIEISAVAAEVARKSLTQVYLDNVETMELPFETGQFDALILSEVLEHLVDPWAALRRLSPFVRTGGLIFASSPNISHYSMIKSLLRGQWTLTDVGAMDRTHLRWFTPKTYRELVEQAGFRVTRCEPVVPHSASTALVIALSGNGLKHLFMRQICVTGVKI